VDARRQLANTGSKRQLGTKNYKLVVNYRIELKAGKTAAEVNAKTADTVTGANSLTTIIVNKIKNAGTDIDIPGFNHAALDVADVTVTAPAATALTVTIKTSGSFTVNVYGDPACSTAYTGTVTGMKSSIMGSFPVADQCLDAWDPDFKDNKNVASDKIRVTSCGIKLRTLSWAGTTCTTAGTTGGITLDTCHELMDVNNHKYYLKATCSGPGGSTSSASSTGLSVAAAGMAAVAATLIM
jgi:hypothetical protein